MEDALVQTKINIHKMRIYKVLILVVMEDALVLGKYFGLSLSTNGS